MTSIVPKSERPTIQRIDYIKSIIEKYTIDPMTDYDNMTTITAADCNMNKKLVNIKAFFDELDMDLRYLKSGSTGHAFKATSRNDRNIELVVKVAAYPKVGYGSVNNMNRPENAELRMIKLLAAFVPRKTPHLVLPVCTSFTCMSDFISLTKDLNIPRNIVTKKGEQLSVFGKFMKNYNKNRFDVLASVFIGEWCNGGDLADFLKRNYQHMTLLDWKTIMFQILFTLAIIFERYPNFRHNDMKANNILVNVTNDPELFPDHTILYKLSNIVFHIPVSKINVKIWDFDFSSIKGIIDNDKSSSEWAEKNFISIERNQYYDLHYFLNTLSTFGFFPDFHRKAPSEIVDFVNRVIPTIYQKNPKYVSKTGRLITQIEYLRPYTILERDELFDEFRRVGSKQ